MKIETTIVKLCRCATSFSNYIQGGSDCAPFTGAVYSVTQLDNNNVKPTTKNILLNFADLSISYSKHIRERERDISRFFYSIS